MSHAMTHGTRSTSSSSFSSVPGPIPPRTLITSTTPCADPRNPQEVAVILNNFLTRAQQDRRQPDHQWTGERDLHWRRWDYWNWGSSQSFVLQQVILVFNPRPAESIATPQEADFDDEQIRALLASPRYLVKREASAERWQVHHSESESLMSSSSQGLKSVDAGDLVALFSRQSRLNQDAFSEREQPVDVWGSNESICRFSNPANVAKSLLDGNRDHLFAQARSELMKQEHKVGISLQLY